MNTSWVVTANSGHAHFFSQKANSSALEKVGDIGNGKHSLHTSETESDRIGQHAASASKHNVGAPTQPSGYQPNQTPAQHQTELFARDVAQYLSDGYQGGKFNQLVITASPEFLGVLRPLLGAELTKIVVKEINKDYTHCNARDLAGYL
jgi:protein required for attachment to host cells